MGWVEHLLPHWGLVAIFAGSMIEGESVVMAGGALAQRGLFPLWAVAAVAFAGTVTMDQLCFVLGRRFRDSKWVCTLRARSAFDRALRFIERYPSAYILAFRFIPGVRIVSPVALGVARVPAGRFVVLNLIAAAAWAPLFAGIGYAAGNAVERVFGRIQSGERFVLLVVGAIVVIAIVVSVGNRVWSKRAGG